MSGRTEQDPKPDVKTFSQPPPLPQYEVLGYLGGGGMGEIFKARHIHLDRVVVVKWLRSDVPVSPQMEKRFAREMLAVGQVTHANVVNATDAGIVDGRRYLVMEYIDGVDLSALRKCVGPLPIAEACEIIRQAAAGLAQAHRRGIVHRDIKPTNIMVAGDGCVKVLDLGLALLQHENELDERTLTSADSGPFGTYDYMSPEQWGDTHNVDHRTDLYSIGCTLYFLLCGHAPFATDRHSTPASKMRGHVLEDVPSIGELRPDVPDELKQLIDHLLVKEPDQRLSSADELAEALRPFAEGSDLGNLVASAHGGIHPPAGNKSTTNPESQTILVGSSHQDVSRKSTIPGQAPPLAKATEGNETKRSHSRTTIDTGATASNRTARWLFAGTVAAALMTAGAAASIYVVMNSGDRDVPVVEPVADKGTPASTPSVPDERTDPIEQTAAVIGVDQETDSGEPVEPVEPDDMEAVSPPVTETVVPVAAVVPVPAVLPVFEPLPLQELRENESATVLVALRDFQELRGKVAFEVGSNAPGGLRIDAETGVIRWQPGEDQGGTGAEFEVTVLARSLDATVRSAETTVRFTVAEVNQPPRLAQVGDVRVADAAPGRLSATEGRPFEVAVVLDDADDPPNPLELAPIGSLPEGARLVRDDDAERTWKLTWTPNERHGGGEDVQVRLRAGDGIAHTDLDLIRIAVAEVNQPPTIASVNGTPFDEDAPWMAEIAEGRPLELTIAAADVDVPPNNLTLAAVGDLPAGARLVPVEQQPRTWKLTWTPSEAHGGGEPVTFRLRAADDDAASEVHAVVVTVAEINVAPELTSINGADVRGRAEFTATAREGRPVEWTLAAADTDLPPNPLTIEAVEPLPDGARIAEVDGERGNWRLSWTPDEATGGSGRDVRIPLRVFDGDARSEVRTLVVRVDEVNAAPDFATIDGEPLNEQRSHSVAVNEGERLSVAIAGTDVDLPKNPLTIASADDLPDGAQFVPDEEDPRLWRLVWTPTEAQGGYAPFEVPLLIRDGETNSRPAKLLVRVDEVNTPPVIAGIEPQTAGPGEEFVLDVAVTDPDLPRQALSFEIEQPESLDARLMWLPLEPGRPQTLRFMWSPDFDRDRGADREFAVRVTDNGTPPLAATRTIQVHVGRYVTNSIGMQLALLPAGEFRMGNLNPEQLEQFIPKVPEVPQEPNPQPGVRPPFGNQTGRPGAPAPAAPSVVPGAQQSADEQAEEEPAEEEKPDDVPVRELPVTQAFYMGIFEVTQAQYEAVMGDNPSYFSAVGPGSQTVADLDPGNLPVETVTYIQAIEFCRRLSERPEEMERGRMYRLPSEIEWEYACRAGTETMYHSGEQLSSTQANFDGRYPARGTRPGPYLRRSTTVGSYEPNAFGLYDMHANVGEWCFDWYSPDAYEQEFDWFGPKEGERRVVRGGSYHSQRAHHTRSSARDSRDPATGSPRIGFRVVCEITGARPIDPGEPVSDPLPDK